MTDVFSFIFPRNLIKLEDKELASRVSTFLATYGSDIHEDLDVACDLESEIRQFKGHFFNDIRDMNGVENILKKLYRTNLMPSFPALSALCMLFRALPVTVANAERSFSKLKIIKTYLRSTMSQDRLDELAMLAIENEEAKSLNVS